MAEGARLRRRVTPPAERFWPKVDKNGPIPVHRPDLGPCWLWTATKNECGYGQFYPGPSDGRNGVMAHRWAYEHEVGPIPEGLDIDHLCRARNCVNPSHLEPVTERVNVLRGNTFTAANLLRTHCPYGHPYSGENLYVRKNGHRGCHTCLRARARERARRLRAINAQYMPEPEKG